MVARLNILRDCFSKKETWLQVAQWKLMTNAFFSKCDTVITLKLKFKRVLYECLDLPDQRDLALRQVTMCTWHCRTRWNKDQIKSEMEEK